MKKSQKWFTLLELMLSVWLIFAIVVSAFIPYSFKQSKARVKITTKILTETITEARNLAVNGLDYNFDTSTPERNNTSVWVLLEKGNDNPLKIFLYKPESTNVKGEEVTNEVALYKEKLIQKDTGLSTINANWEKDNLLIYFEAITGEVKIYDKDGTELTDAWNEIKFNISYKASTETSLNKDITYFPLTNVIDY